MMDNSPNFKNMWIKDQVSALQTVHWCRKAIGTHRSSKVTFKSKGSNPILNTRNLNDDLSNLLRSGGGRSRFHFKGTIRNDNIESQPFWKKAGWLGRNTKSASGASLMIDIHQCYGIVWQDPDSLTLQSSQGVQHCRDNQITELQNVDQVMRFLW